jgi:hypothetical protein
MPCVNEWSTNCQQAERRKMIIRYSAADGCVGRVKKCNLQDTPAA